MKKGLSVIMAICGAFGLFLAVTNKSVPGYIVSVIIILTSVGLSEEYEDE